MTLLDFLDPTKTTYWDVETISYDDTRGALYPYHGDKTAGISIAQNGVAVYFPLRHRNDIAGCVPFESTIAEIRDFATKCVAVENLNVKFDLHFLETDGVKFSDTCRFMDLGTKARIVNNTHLSYSLEALANIYNKTFKKEANPIKKWLHDNATKDYGAIPLPLVTEYAKYDTLAAEELSHQLDARMPSDSLPVWDEEQKFTRLLFDSEKSGLPLNVEFCKSMAMNLLMKMDKLQTKLHDITKDPEFNPASPAQVAAYFRRQGIEPVAWNEDKETKEKTPSWGKDALAQIIDPISNPLIEYNEAKVACGTFALGWSERCAPDGCLHPHFNQSGTRTGRVSSYDPNMQNPPPWAMYALTIPKGYIGVKFDYSQIEYRIFAHYSQDEGLIELYQKNPKTDFHQIIADRLGMGAFRKVIKPINFGILYGMGKKKMKKQLAKTIHDLKDELNPEQYQELIDYLSYQYSTPECHGNFEVIGENIIKEYHRLTPAIKKLLSQIKSIVAQRGNIRNYFKRFYQFDLDKVYVALNYLCQGTGADLFKSRVNAIFYDPRVRSTGAQLKFNIHDSIGAIVEEKYADEYIALVNAIACDVPGLRVPILIDWEIARDNWGNCTKLAGTALETYAGLA